MNRQAAYSITDDLKNFLNHCVCGAHFTDILEVKTYYEPLDETYGGLVMLCEADCGYNLQVNYIEKGDLTHE